jgi:hypothetical protein
MMALEFEFGGTAHRNSWEMHDAIAEEWLGAAGSNTIEDIEQLLRQSDDALADNAADGFGLAIHPSFDRTALRDAFARFRENFARRYQAD